MLQESKSKNLKKIERQKANEREMREQEQRLREEDRRDAQERNKRIEAYKKKKYEDKILEDKRKVEDLMDKKKKLRAKRNEFRIKTQIQKDKLLRTFDKMKVCVVGI